MSMRLWHVCILAVSWLGACDHKPQVQSSAKSSLALQPSIMPTPLASQVQQPSKSNFDEVSQYVRRAVAVVSVFDDTGRLSATSYGLFLSDDGKLITDRSIMAGAVNAVAKMGTGAIYNVSGALGYGVTQSFVLLKADARRVPFVSVSTSSVLQVGDTVAVILSPIERAKNILLTEKLTNRLNDHSDEWFEADPALPRTSIGAPVINERGEVVGIVGYRAENNKCVIRPAAAAHTLLAQAPPDVTATWQPPQLTSSAPATVSASVAAVSPIAPKSPARAAVQSKLVYTPSPRYPSELKQGRGGIRGAGSYRIHFDSSGRATAVQVIRSAGHMSLDSAAITALNQWRSDGGHDWTLVVPITFQP